MKIKPPELGSILIVKRQIGLLNFRGTEVVPDCDYRVVQVGEKALLVEISDDEWSILVDGSLWFYGATGDWPRYWEVIHEK